VNSTPGKGTSFTIKLPASGVSADTMESVVAPVA
jgi:signal transduction histidine kinase